MLPNLIVIGAARSGTTSLHSYLDLHPEISMSSTKELDFFVLEKNWPKGIEWYKSNFTPTDETKVLGESSPSYTMCHVFSGVPQRMHRFLPEARLIYILRDPIDRIVSHYMYNYRRRREARKLSEALTDLEINYYVLCSKYYTQLEQYLSYFPQPNIHVITLENLFSNCQKTMQEAFQFLGVDNSFYSQDFSNTLHRSSDKRRINQMGLLWSRVPGKHIIKSLLPFPSYSARVYRSLSYSKVKKPTLTKKLKQELIDYLQDDINRLRRHVSNNFERWCL